MSGQAAPLEAALAARVTAGEPFSGDEILEWLGQRCNVADGLRRRMPRLAELAPADAARSDATTLAVRMSGTLTHARDGSMAGAMAAFQPQFPLLVLRDLCRHLNPPWERLEPRAAGCGAKGLEGLTEEAAEEALLLAELRECFPGVGGPGDIPGYVAARPESWTLPARGLVHGLVHGLVAGGPRESGAGPPLRETVVPWLETRPRAELLQDIVMTLAPKHDLREEFFSSGERFPSGPPATWLGVPLEELLASDGAACVEDGCYDSVEQLARAYRYVESTVLPNWEFFTPFTAQDVMRSLCSLVYEGYLSPPDYAVGEEAEEGAALALEATRLRIARKLAILDPVLFIDEFATMVDHTTDGSEEVSSTRLFLQEVGLPADLFPPWLTSDDSDDSDDPDE